MEQVQKFIVSLFFVFFTFHEAYAQESSCRIATTAFDIASRIRGLKIERTVPCKLQDRQQVERFLRENLNKKIPIEKVQSEAKVYKVLGVIPKDYDYVNGLIKLYTDQLGGYYDPEKGYYAMASWMPGAMQMPIAVHELTHALQDQHYNLEKFMEEKDELSDVLMARQALVEGDATAVMHDYARGLTGQPSIATESSIRGLIMQNLAGAMLSSSLHTAPAALQNLLIFPYTSGLSFVHSLLRVGGYKKVDQAFLNSPVSTEEILHPDKFLSEKKDFTELPERLPPPEVQITNSKPLYSDRMGEFLISTFLGTWLSPTRASAAAAGWGGDRLLLYQASGKSGSVVMWVLLWDTEKDSEEFFSALSDAYEKRFSQKGNRAGNEVTFTDGDYGKFVVRREEKEVVLLGGLP